MFPYSDGTQQYITLPLSMMSGGVLNVLDDRSDSNAVVVGSSAIGNVPKVAAASAGGASSSSISHNNRIVSAAKNGRESSPSSSPIELIIKKENLEQLIVARRSRRKYFGSTAINLHLPHTDPIKYMNTPPNALNCVFSHLPHKHTHYILRYAQNILFCPELSSRVHHLTYFHLF